MRNLKKVLALTLVLALSLSMVISAGAGFSDVKPTDTNASAINLLSSLSVIGGYPDGTFKGENAYTRAEFTSVLFRALKGTADTSLYVGATSFPDVNVGDWYNGAVNWGISSGIIDGYPDGTFKPDRAITVAEATKMVVVALGYDTKNYTFPFGFVNKAQEIGLLEGVTGVGYDTPASRSLISGVIYNSLFLGIPLYPIQNITTGIVTGYDTLATKVFGIKSQVAQLTGTSTAKTDTGITASGKVALAYDTSTTSTPNILTFTPSYGFDVDNLLFHQVKVWYKGTTTLDGNSTIVNIVDDTNTVVTAKLTAFAADGANYKITVDGTTYSGLEPQFNDASYVKVAVNGVIESSATDIGYRTADATITLVKPNKTGNWYASIAAPVVTKITAVEAGKFVALNSTPEFTPAYAGVTAGGVLYFKSDDGNVLNTVYDNPAVGDVVYAYPKNTTSGVLYDVVKGTEVTNVTLNSVSGGTYTFGGTAYTLATTVTNANDVVFNKAYNLILNSVGKIGKIAAYDGSAGGARTDLILVTGIAASYGITDQGMAWSSSITGLLTDGTSTTLALDNTGMGVDNGDYWKVDTTGSATGNRIYDTAKERVFSFVKNASGKVTSLTEVTTFDPASVLSYDASTKAIKIGSSIQAIAGDSTVVYYKSGSTYGVYVGKNIPSFTSAVGSTSISTDNKVILSLAITGAGGTANSTALYGRILSRTVTADETTAAYTYSVAVNSKIESLTTESKPLVANASTQTAALANLDSAFPIANNKYARIYVDKTTGKVTQIDELTPVLPASVGTSGTFVSYDKVTAFNGSFLTLDSGIYLVDSAASFINVSSTGTHTAGTAGNVRVSTTGLTYKVDFITVDAKIVAVFVYPANTATAAESLLGGDAITAAKALLTKSAIETKLAARPANIVSDLQALVNNPAVVASIDSSSAHPAITTAGAVTYNATATPGTLIIKLVHGNVTSTHSVANVIVPQSADGADVDAAAVTLGTTFTVTKSLSGSAENLKTEIETAIAAHTGVTVTLTATSKVAADGTVTYPATVGTDTDTVIVTLTKGTATKNVTLAVTIETIA